MESVQLYNSPLEAGLRCLFVLEAAPRRSFDVQRLIYLDYALVHTSDLEGPASLHPPSPTRRQQLLVRRELIQEGVELLRSRDLAERLFLTTGIAYRVTAAGRYVAESFSSEYAQLLRERAKWVVTNFAPLSDVEIRRRFSARVDPFRDELVLSDIPGEIGTWGR